MTSAATQTDTLFFDPDPRDYSLTHVLFVDLKSCPDFFKRLSGRVHPNMFVFAVAPQDWERPINCEVLDRLDTTRLHIGPCGSFDKSGALAICIHVGRLSELLPARIKFIVASSHPTSECLEHLEKKHTLNFINPETKSDQQLFDFLRHV